MTPDLESPEESIDWISDPDQDDDDNCPFAFNEPYDEADDSEDEDEDDEE